ncbi:hypothetical protein K7432_012831, partial [Basidiobolus ranarum]
MPVTKPMLTPYLTTHYDGAPNKGLHIPYHSQESITSQHSGGLTDTSAKPDHGTSTHNNVVDDCFAADLLSLYKVPSRFVFRDSKKEHKQSHHKRFGFFSLHRRHVTPHNEPKVPISTKHYMPLLEALRKRDAPSLNQLYGDFTSDICSGAGGGVRQTNCP